jgi:RNA polymerase sigma factor (sigma-70 family)
MQEQADIQLLRQYAEKNSEAAFGELVTRYVNLVYSAAARKTGSLDAAEEITQAVFIILARKAKTLRKETILSGWLYQTARLTAANFLRNEIRRSRREQEASMQSLSNETEAWPEIEPLLEDAMGGLNDKERNAIVLRFFEGRSFQEIGTVFGGSENAAKKRVIRGLEKLRKFFAKRGVSSTTAIIGDNISAHSVQVAPAALAKAVAAVAVAKGVAGSASTLTLVKGALKLMAWTKAKTAIVASAAILLTAGTATIVAQKMILPGRAVLKQWLPDGSLLTLRAISYGDKHEFVEGGKRKSMNWPGHEQLIFQLALTGKNAANNPLVKQEFYRQVRGMLGGEQGIEYAEELFALKSGGDGYYGYIEVSSFPRDSRWLSLRLEKAATNNPYSGWETMAQFRIANPASLTNRNWTAETTPINYSTNDMRFVLGEITVQTNAQRDIWNHAINVPITVLQNGAQVTNWEAIYIQVADASGNWNYWGGLPAWMSLDPRFVWKLDMDFEPTSGFTPEDMVTITLPKRNSQAVANVRDIPVTISWDGTWIDADIPTNHPDLALKFVEARTAQNEVLRDSAGSWGKSHFRKGDFMVERGGVLHFDGVSPNTVTVAIVPNIHTTFYAQPSVVTDSVAQQ